MKRKKSKYKDKRDWNKYNEELVMRGYFYINPAFLKTWNDEIKKMNDGKNNCNCDYGICAIK